MGGRLIYQDEKTEVFREGNDLMIVFKQPHTLRINSKDRRAIDDEVIRMLHMRTAAGKKYFLQKEVGKI